MFFAQATGTGMTAKTNTNTKSRDEGYDRGWARNL